MAQIESSEVLAKLQQAMVRVPLAGGVKKSSLMDEEKSFQKLLDQKTQSAKPDSAQTKESDTQSAPTAEKPETEGEVQTQEEDPVELSKRAALVVTLAPMTQEELNQIPQELLPQVGEGEGVVCVGVEAGPNGEDVPILMGEREAAAQYGGVAGSDIAQPQQGEAAQAELQPQTLPQTQAQPQEQAQAQPEQASAETVQTAQPQAEVKTEVQTDTDAQPQTQEEGEDTQVLQADAQPQTLFRDVEAAPIKVGEAPVSEEAPSVENQVDTQVFQAVSQGDSKVVIQLTPENLGQVTVEITRSEDGSLHVMLSAENNQTRGLLEKHANHLQELLASRQEETVQVQVQRQEESQRQQQHGYEDREGRNGQRQQQEQEQEQRRERNPQRVQDFLQQLRLGLIPMDADE